MLLTEPTAGAGSRSSEADRWDVGTETISLDLSWCPSPTVHEGRLHVPGAPAALRTSNTTWIARLDAHRWTLLPQPIQGRVNAAFSWSGWLVIAGSFESAGEVRDESIAWWHEGTWKPFPAPKGKSLQGRVELIAGSETESLVVAGRTLKIGGVDSPGVVRWHGEWLPAGGGLAMARDGRGRARGCERAGGDGELPVCRWPV